LNEENDRLVVAHIKIQEDLNSHLSSCSSKSVNVPINREEINDMKNIMNDLSSTLSKCAFDNAKLESMFRKKPTLSSHTSHISHASHAHHVHHNNHTHHAFMYANVYNCTFCGRKGHISKFCYDRLNMSNTSIWVKKTNTTRPKRMWVPKSSQCHVDVGTKQVKPT